MKDCSQEIRKFHNDEVNLPGKLRDQLRENKIANRNRLKEGLEKNGDPKPTDFVTQGSYAMKTTIQEKDNDYDIDDGAKFKREDLKGPQGGEKSPLEARQMVRDAVDDKKFKTPPKVKTNCVRVFYDQGHHVDIPVYRILTDDLGNDTYELASSVWKESNPEGVNDWFSEKLNLRPFDQDNSHQMRRMIRLLKCFGKSRPTWNMPSGFIMTVLVDESYQTKDDREDRAFYDQMVAIRDRLRVNLIVKHPVVDEDLTKTNTDPQMVTLREKLDWAIEELKVLFDPQCTKKAALKAWGKVFGTDFFDNLLEEEAIAKSTFGIASGIQEEPVDKRGGGRFGDDSDYEHSQKQT